MVNQDDLFSRPAIATQHEADTAKERGMYRSAEASGETWQEYALEVLRDYLERHEFMHVDQLWDHGLQRPESPRALGWVMRTAVEKKWMQLQMVEGDILARPSRNSNNQLKPVWRSNICRVQK